MWSERWSEREKARSHTWHLNGFWPVCFLKWRVNSSERANLQWQPSQVQWYGFSPWNIKKEYSISKVLVLAVDLAYSAYSISCNFRCGFRMIWWPSVFTRNFLVLLMRFSKIIIFLNSSFRGQFLFECSKGKRWQATLFSTFVQSFLIPSMSVFNILVCNVKIALLTHWRINKTHKST